MNRVELITKIERDLSWGRDCDEGADTAPGHEAELQATLGDLNCLSSGPISRLMSPGGPGASELLPR